MQETVEVVLGGHLHARIKKTDGQGLAFATHLLSLDLHASCGQTRSTTISHQSVELVARRGE